MRGAGTRGGIALLVAGVVSQFLLEVTLGRIFAAPNVLALALVYLSLNRGSRCSVDGAFWSGLALDLLLHQPPGASSLALMAALWVSSRIAGASAGENRMVLLVLTAITSVVSDSLFILIAARIRGWGGAEALILVLPRLAMTMILGLLIVSVGTGIDFFRRVRHA